MSEEKIKQKHNKLLVRVWVPVLFAVLSFVLIAAVLFVAFGGTVATFTTKSGSRTVSLQTEFTPAQETGEPTVPLADIEFPKPDTAFGEIEIPSCEIKCTLFYGNSEAVLDAGAGQYIGSCIPGYCATSLITAHNNTHFAGLDKIQAGDEIIVRTTYGVYRYAVLSTAIFSEDSDEAYALTKGKEMLTLYTCYRRFTSIGKISERFYVYADLVSGPAIVE